MRLLFASKQKSAETVFFIFLPTLIFEAALHINVRQLIHDIAPILMLAIVGLLASTFVIGYSVWVAGAEVSIVTCLLLGAIVSATDPVAVTALFKELGAPKRLEVLVEGESLTEVIQRSGVDGMLDWREVWRVAVQIGRGLHEASKHQIIHRNLTPNNILRRESDRACLLGDLMLAKALEGSLAVQITRPGQMIGEIPYMSPERTRGTEDVDTRSDIYGLGATLYALLTGRAPVEGKSLPELVQNARETVPAAPKDFQLSIEDSFQDAVMRMLEKDPDRRYQTADQLLRELHRIGKFHSLQADWTGWTA